MGIKNKIKSILADTSGETIVEVLVAFMLLSIILLMFAQGITSASKAEITATRNRNNADQAMIDLKNKLASGSPDTSDGSITKDSSISVGDGNITPYIYTVNGNKYVVYMPE